VLQGGDVAAALNDAATQANALLSAYITANQ
jgi:hypothetical protein